jgi:hypothetical protein
MDLFAPAPVTHPVTQEGYNVMLATYRRINSVSPLMFVQIIMQEMLTLFFPLQVKYKPYDKVQFVHLFLNWGGCKQFILNWSTSSITQVGKQKDIKEVKEKAGKRMKLTLLWKHCRYTEHN